MNYLAHAYLSFQHTDILIGNMSSDFIKGKKKFDYPAAIQKGITLHREIDDFTDNHPATATAKTYLRSAAGLYAGAFVDIIYDHFLANDRQQFADEKSLAAFASSTYQVLEQNKHLLPENFQHMLPYMQKDNWLYNYRSTWGTWQSFQGLSRRSAYMKNAQPVFEAFENNYAALQACYDNFFHAVKNFTVTRISDLLQV